jgi:hypothetical protein
MSEDDLPSMYTDNEVNGMPVRQRKIVQPQSSPLPAIQEREEAVPSLSSPVAFAAQSSNTKEKRKGGKWEAGGAC